MPVFTKTKTNIDITISIKYPKFEMLPEFRKCWDVFFFNLNKMKTKIILFYSQ